MDTLTRFIFASAASIVSAASILADHGRDFLVVQDYTLPAPLSGNVLGNFTWERNGGEDEFALEGGFFLGLAPRLGIETSVGFLDEGNGWDYSSVDPALHVQLTPPDSEFPIRAGVSVGYQFGAADEVDVDHHVVGGHDEPAEHEEEGHGHHDETDEAADHHEHSGIHRHGEDLFHARLILETDFTDQLKGVFNLIAVVPDGGDVAWGYSAGLRYSFNRAVAAGVEAIGDFAGDGEHEALLAGYFTPIHALSLKVGVGAGLTDESPDFSPRTGLVWRF